MAFQKYYPYSQKQTAHNFSQDLQPEHLADKVESIYEDEEKKTAGYLWVDHLAQKYIVTLGLANGVEPGKKLWVYDQTQKIGDVKVEQALDVISYVVPLFEAQALLTKDYYQVYRDE